MSIWYTARGAGLAALLAFTLATTLGALTSIKIRNAATRVVVQYTHRTAAALGLLLLVVHISLLLIDKYAGVGVIGAFVPLQSGYRPKNVALGSLALYVFLTVAALGFARGRMAASARGARTWRGVHLLSYAGWGLAILHGFTSGTDTGKVWVDAIYLLCLASVLGALTVRFLTAARAGTIRRAMEPVGATS